MRIFRFALRIALLLLPMLLTTCSTPAQERYYVLSASTKAPQIVLEKFDRDIVVQLMSVPELIDRPQIVLLNHYNEPVILDDDRWADSIRSDLIQVISLDLSKALPNAWVTQMTSDRASDPMRVQIRIEEMRVVLNQKAELSANWTVRNASGEVMTSGRLDVERDVGPNARVRDIVTLWSDELNELSQAIAQSIGKSGPI